MSDTGTVICGNCKKSGQTVEHVKACFADRYATKTAEPVAIESFTKAYVESRDFTPMALDIPDSKYALMREAGPVFYELRTGTNGKWKGFKFLDRLIGAPGDWKRTRVTGKAKSNIMAELGKNPKEAVILFGKEFTTCGVCNSPLSDPASMAAGIGPICAKRF